MTAESPSAAFPFGAKSLVALRAIVLVLAGGWVFSPALPGDWVWDDRVEISQNAGVHDPAGLGKIWFAPAGTDYFPLKTTVQWLEWCLWGNRTTGYHGLNVGLHLLSAILLWSLLRKLGMRWAWLGGLLFALHPLAVESVAWISELKNTLSLPLLLGAMIAYLNYDDFREVPVERIAPYALAAGRSRASAWGAMRSTYFLSLLFFLLAMLSKSSVAMFPCVILLYAWWKRGRIDRRDLIASAPFFLISFALGLVTIWFQHYRAIAGGAVDAGGLFPRLAGAGLAVAFYFFKGVLPVGLMPIYPGWKLAPPSLAQLLPWLGLVLVLGWLWRRRATWGRPALFGLGWFFLNLVPVLGLVPMAYQRISWVADHLAYLPLVGLVGLAAAGVGALQERISPERSWPMAIAAGLLCALLALASHRYAGIFRNDRTLWAYAVEKNPHSTFAQNNLGNALYLDGHVAEAAARYAKALQLDPEDVEAHYNLGNILAEGGRIPEAISEYRQAIKLQPDLYEAPASIGYLGGAPDPSALGAVDSLNAAAIIYGKEVPHQDLWVSYKMRLPFIDNRIRSTLQLNCRDLWSNGYLQTVQVNPDGSPVTYRIIAPRQWYLQETFDF